MKLRIVFVTLIVFLLLLSPALARKGVGIVWNTETEIVTEGATHCIQYGIYNPWDENVNALLGVSDEFKPIIEGEESHPRMVEGGTTHDKAVPIDLCFDIEEVYKKECLVGDFFCEQRCDVEPVTHEGKILVKEEKSGGSGMGSATALGVSVPLKLKVHCNAHPRDWTLLYLGLSIILLLVIIIILLKRRKKK